MNRLTTTRHFVLFTLYYIYAAVVELAYTYVSGTYESNLVRVQVPPAAPNNLASEKILALDTANNKDMNKYFPTFEKWYAIWKQKSIQKQREQTSIANNQSSPDDSWWALDSKMRAVGSVYLFSLLAMTLIFGRFTNDPFNDNNHSYFVAALILALIPTVLVVYLYRTRKK